MPAKVATQRSLSDLIICSATETMTLKGATSQPRLLYDFHKYILLSYKHKYIYIIVHKYLSNNAAILRTFQA